MIAWTSRRVGFRAFLAIAFGICALAWPRGTMVAALIALGAYAIADGIYLAYFSWMSLPRSRARRLHFARAFVNIAFGMLAIFFTERAFVSIGVLIGAWAIVTGGLEVGLALHARGKMPGAALLGIVGAASIVFGLLALATPAAFVVILTVFAGGYAIVMGSSLIGIAITLRRAEQQHAALV